MVRLRLKRMGRRHRPFYRLCVMDQRSQRDGSAIEELGFYDPIEPDAAKGLRLKAERVRYWLSVGARPSDTVRSLIRKAGITTSSSGAGAEAGAEGTSRGGVGAG